MSKFTKMTKAELIDLLEMEKRRAARQADACVELQKIHDEDCGIINHLSSNLDEANRQLESFKETIDDLTSEKVSAMEAAKAFNKEAKVAKNWSYVFAIVAVIAIAIAIIF